MSHQIIYKFTILSVIMTQLLLLISVTQAAAAVDFNVAREVAHGVLKCAIQHQVSPYAIMQLLTVQDKTTIPPTESIKCFTKCTVIDSGFVDANGVNVETFVRNKVGLGQNEATVRAQAARCKHVYRGINDCETSWQLYLCFNQRF